MNFKLFFVLFTAALSAGCGLIHGVTSLSTSVALIPVAIGDGVLGTHMARSARNGVEEAFKEGKLMQSDDIKSETVRKINPNLKVGPSDWVVNDGACALTFPENLIRQKIKDRDGFNLSKILSEIAQNNTLKWKGSCDAGGKANGNGELSARFHYTDKVRQVFTTNTYNVTREGYILLKGEMVNGQFYGELVMEVSEGSGSDPFGSPTTDTSKHFILNGETFTSLRDLQEYENPLLKTTRLEEEERKIQEKERRQKQDEREQREAEAKHEVMLQKFRKNIKIGDDTSDGVITEIKGSLIKIQTNQSQCSQRNYKDNCVNWINTPVEKWFKRSEVYPR